MSTEAKYLDGAITPEFHEWLNRRDDVYNEFISLNVDVTRWADACNRVSAEPYGIVTVGPKTTLRDTINWNRRLCVGTAISALRIVGKGEFADKLATKIADPKDIKLREYLGTHMSVRAKLQTLLSGCWEHIYTQYSKLNSSRFNGEGMLRIKSSSNNELSRCGDFIRYVEENYRVADTLQDLFTCLIASNQISVLELFGPYAPKDTMPPPHPPKLMCGRCSGTPIGIIRLPCHHAAECDMCRTNPKCIRCDVESRGIVSIHQ